MKFPVLRAFLACVALLLAACGSDPATCAIHDNGDGTSTIECPGAPPTRVVDARDGTLCTLGVGDDGGKVISCTDGTLVRIDENGNVIFPGTGIIEGRALLFGMDNHAGIHVFAAGTEYETTTDAEGRYALGPLPAGIHVVVFEAPGRITERRANVPVINGSWQLETVQLKFARHVAANGSVVPTPDGEAVLAFTQTSVLGGWLQLWELDQEDPLQLGSLVSQFSTSDDGKRVLYQEHTAIDGPLQLWDRATKQRTEITARSVRGEISPTGDAIVFETHDDDGACSLHVWQRSTGSATRVDGCTASFFWPFGPRIFPFGADGKRFLYQDAEGRLQVHDIEAGASHLVAPTFTGLDTRFLPDGRHVITLETRNDFSGLVDLWMIDGATGDRREIAIDTTGDVRVSPDGGTIVAWRNATEITRNLVAWRVEDEAALVVASGVSASKMAFSPDGGRLLWIEGEAWQAGPLHVIELASPENPASYRTRSVLQAEFAGVGTTVLLTDANGAVHFWDPRTGADELFEAAPSGGLQWSPDRRKVSVMTQGSEVAIADLAGGGRYRAPGDPFANSSLWEPDGAGIVYVRTSGDGTSDLIRWEPPADPQRLGGGFLGGFLISPRGTVAFLECTGSCAGGQTLVLHDRERNVREPVDAPVFFFALDHGVLVYQMFSPNPEDADRNGFYAAKVP